MAREKILVVDNNRIDIWFLQQYLSRKDYLVETTDIDHFFRKLEIYSPDLIILSFDFFKICGPRELTKIGEVSKRTLIVLLVSHREIEKGRMTRKVGIFDYIIKPYNMDEIEIVTQKALETARLKRPVGAPIEKKTDRFGFHHLIGRSPAFTEVIDLARKVAKSDSSTVLLQGESGTGKDGLAKAIHFESSRYRNPFMEISCAALPETLLESELFGYERGAFTGARGRKEGLFSLAEGGTVFLNEIGDMPPSLQAKILRLIEQKTFKMIGGARDIQVDVRIIAATCVLLKEAVDRGTFRPDLYYRLNVVPITIPPLRERREDILPLAEHFLGEYNRQFHREVKGFTPEAKESLQSYHWPGNVREIKNIIERVMILESSDLILAEHLPLDITGAVRHKAEGTQDFVLPEGGVPLVEVEEQLIRQALEKCNYNLSGAARMLHIGRDALRYRLKKLRISGGEQS